MNKKISLVIFVLFLLVITSCSKKTYVVGFDTFGGTQIDDQNVKENENVIRPNDPTKEGHTFLGWYLDDKEYDFNSKIDKHLIIQAKWKANEYKVSFITNTEQTINDVTVKYGEKIEKPNITNSDCFEFIGWYLNDEIYDFNSKVTSDITLVAKWEKVKYEIKFVTNADVYIESQYIQEKGLATKPNISNEGYNFLGWYLNDEIYDFNSEVTSDITLVAKWKKIQYTIRFNTDTDEEIENRYVDYGAYLTEPEIYLEGYDFLGWYFKDELYDFSKPVYGHANLFARWEMSEELVKETLDNTVKSETKTNINLFSYLEKCSAEFIWSSSDEEVISSYGRVARFTKDKYVTLTVIVLYSDYQYEMEFETLVPKVTLKPLIKGQIVSGYLADYGSFTGISDKMIEQLDYINYSFGGIYNGELVLSSYLNEELILSYREKGVRIGLAIGGWGADGFSQAVRTAEGRTKFVKSIMKVIKEYQFDGIDLDWEYPGTGVAGIEYHSSDKNNLTLFCQELSKAMKSYGEDLILSIAIAPTIAYYDLAALNKYIDIFNVMTYDFAMGSKAAHDSNLYGYGSTTTSMANSVEFVKKYVDADKIIPGAAFYTRRGYFASESNQKLGASLSISMSHTPLSYGELTKMLLDNPDIVELYDEVAEAAYIIHNRWFYSYDNPRSIKAKCDYVKDNNLGGLMCWDLTDDYIDEEGTGVLVNAMYENLK